MIHCLHCGAETSNGLALCELCRLLVVSILEHLPIYFTNLSRWRPGRSGTSRPVPGSRVLYDGEGQRLGTGDRISDTLDEAANMLLTRARELVKDRPHFPRPLTLTDAVLSGDLSDETAEQLIDNPARTVASLCDGFGRHLTSISTLDWCGDFARDLSHHEEHLRDLMPLVPGWYAGGCRQVVGFDDEGAAVRCESGTYVTPGLTWVTCGACGATTYARDHLDVVLDEAREWVARPMRIAEAIVALVDTEQSVARLHKRISKWGERGRIQALRRVDADGDEVGPKRFRLGDVLGALATEGATRLNDNTPRAS